MPDTWAAQWQAGLQSSRFNTHHAAAGSPAGGQFAPGSGSSSGSSKGAAKGGAKPAAAHSPAKAAPPPPAASGARKARQDHLRDKAKADRAQARDLQAQLHALEKQHATSAKAAKIAATAAKHPHKTAAHKAAAHHKAHKARKHHASVAHRISALRTRIHTLLAQARQLDAQAAKL